MHKLLCLWTTWSVVLIFSGFASSALAAVKSQVIEYSIDGEPFQGYLSYDDAIKGKRPGILLVHEWWGHNEYVQKRARMLAKLGYTAFALDMYGQGKLADHPDDAKKFMQDTLANMDRARQRFNVALDLLKQQTSVNSNQIAAIGYCFGGGIVLNMARMGMDLDAVVSFHGSLQPQVESEPGAIKAKILVFNGAADPFVKVEQVKAFEQEMTQAGANFKLVNYPGVKHSFTNPSVKAVAEKFGMPLQYDAEADKNSWWQMRTFFKRIFGSE